MRLDKYEKEIWDNLLDLEKICFCLLKEYPSILRDMDIPNELKIALCNRFGYASEDLLTH